MVLDAMIFVFECCESPCFLLYSVFYCIFYIPNIGDIRLPWWFSGTESACNSREVGSIPGLGRSVGGAHGNLLQYSFLENPMDRGAWQATVQRIVKNHTHRWTINPTTLDQSRSDQERKIMQLFEKGGSL